MPGFNQLADSQSILSHKYCRTALVQSPLTSLYAYVCLLEREQSSVPAAAKSIAFLRFLQLFEGRGDGRDMGNRAGRRLITKTSTGLDFKPN